MTEVRPPSRRRAPQRLPGRHRQRGRRGGMRRAQRACRHEGGVRAGRRDHPGDRRAAQARADPRRRQQRHAVLGRPSCCSARTMPASSSWRRTRRSARPASEVIRRRGAGDRGRGDPQPRRLLRRARHRARARGGRARHAQDRAISSRLPGAFDAGLEISLDFPPGEAAACPLFVGRRVPGRAQRPEPGLAAGAADRGRACGRSRRWSTSPTS